MLGHAPLSLEKLKPTTKDVLDKWGLIADVAEQEIMNWSMHDQEVEDLNLHHEKI